MSFTAPAPFNSVAEFVISPSINWTQGDPRTVESAEFEYDKINAALQLARNEIYKHTGYATANDIPTAARYYELREAELYLAAARLCTEFGMRFLYSSIIGDSNIAQVGDVMSGADTPSPLEKSEHWTKALYRHFRNRGIELMNGKPFAFVSDSPEAIDNTSAITGTSSYGVGTTENTQYA